MLHAITSLFKWRKMNVSNGLFFGVRISKPNFKGISFGLGWWQLHVGRPILATATGVELKKDDPRKTIKALIIGQLLPSRVPIHWVVAIMALVELSGGNVHVKIDPNSPKVKERMKRIGINYFNVPVEFNDGQFPYVDVLRPQNAHVN